MWGVAHASSWPPRTRARIHHASLTRAGGGAHDHKRTKWGGKNLKKNVTAVRRQNCTRPTQAQHSGQTTRSSRGLGARGASKDRPKLHPAPVPPLRGPAHPPTAASQGLCWRSQLGRSSLGFLVLHRPRSSLGFLVLRRRHPVIRTESEVFANTGAALVGQNAKQTNYR